MVTLYITILALTTNTFMQYRKLSGSIRKGRETGSFSCNISMFDFSADFPPKSVLQVANGILFTAFAVLTALNFRWRVFLLCVGLYIAVNILRYLAFSSIYKAAVRELLHGKKREEYVGEDEEKEPQ